MDDLLADTPEQLSNNSACVFTCQRRNTKHYTRTGVLLSLQISPPSYKLVTFLYNEIPHGGENSFLQLK